MTCQRDEPQRPSPSSHAVLNRNAQSSTRTVMADVVFGTHRSAGNLEEVNIKKLRHRAPNDPIVYSASLNCLAGVARRGVCLLVVHDSNRAAVAHAALLRKKQPVNFTVTTSATAKEMLQLSSA